METLVKAMGLNREVAIGSPVNKEYYYDRECNSGHKDLTDEEIVFIDAWYDGHTWTVPCCLRCIRAKNERPSTELHLNNKKVHLKERKPNGYFFFKNYVC